MSRPIAVDFSLKPSHSGGVVVTEGLGYHIDRKSILRDGYEVLGFDPAH